MVDYRKIAKQNLPIKCSMCSSKRFLNVHHKDHNRENNKLSNLTFLCRSCHNLEHPIPSKLRAKISRATREHNLTKKVYKYGEDHPSWNGGKIKQSCICRKEFSSWPSQKRMYCSRYCTDKNRHKSAEGQA